MPSSSFDPWFAGRRFGIVIDAGSSGSRLQIYSWLLSPHSNSPSLPSVQRGSKDPDAWMAKTEPGISSFSPHTIHHHLAPLLQHATDHIPPSLHSQTPIFLYATAGMRLLPIQDQKSLLQSACDFIRFHSNFRVTDTQDDDDDESSDDISPRPCQNHVRVISGEEEGLFGWIAVNYLINSFNTSTTTTTTFGFLDMGGASAQIAFKVDQNTPSSIPVSLNLLNGESIHHNVFVTTWLGYGTNQARQSYVDNILSLSPDHSSDPCLPRGLSIDIAGTRHNPILIEEEEEEEEEELVALSLHGTGSFDQCLSLSAQLLHSHSLLPFPLPLETTPFVGVSEYWYTSEHVFGLGGTYDDNAFQSAARKFCESDWESIQNQYLHNEAHHHPHASHIDEHRLQMQCFKSAWIMNVLHLGLGMPRSLMKEEEGVVTLIGEHGTGVVVHLPDSKPSSETPPMFQSVDAIHDTTISWALGKMVLEASREIGRVVKQQPDIQPEPEFPAPHSLLTPSSPGSDALSSSFALVFYITALLLLFVLSCRLGMWYRVKVGVRRWWRKGPGQVLVGKFGGGGAGRWWWWYGEEMEMEEGFLDHDANSSSSGAGMISFLLSIPFLARSSGKKKKMRGRRMRRKSEHLNEPLLMQYPLQESRRAGGPIPPRVINRSASLPVVSSSSSSSASSSPPSGHSTPYTSYPNSLSNTLAVSSSTTTTTTSSSSPPTTTSSTTAFNPLAQSRSRNSSQVSLVSAAGPAAATSSVSGDGGGLLQIRSRNSSQISLVRR